jgi:iron(III) transport system ATP-binding protein
VGLSYSIGQTAILDSISLEVGAGEFIVVAGPSGAGKTTLLRLIAGLERPTAGTIEIAGREASSPRRVVAPAARGVGMVFEHAALWPHLTAEEHVGLVLRARHVAAAERRERIARLFEQLGLSALSGRFPHELSAGERQRVALARSLALSPRLLLLDEPLAHLDVSLAAELASLLVELHRRESLTTLCVMHRPEGVNAATSRYVILEKGRIVAALAKKMDGMDEMDRVDEVDGMDGVDGMDEMDRVDGMDGEKEARTKGRTAKGAGERG